MPERLRIPWPLWALTLLLAVGVQPVCSHAADTPPSLAGATVVSAKQAKALIDQGVLIVDTRVAHEYVDEHIRGAVNIPYREKSAKSVDFDARLDHFDLKRLPAGKDTPVIFYCNAGECWKSYKACKMALKNGYTKVYWLRGGIPEWKAERLPVD